jgi:hypothetical protein
MWSLSFWISYQNLHAFLFSPTHATCLAHLILLALIIPIIFGEEYGLWSFPLWSTIQLPTNYTKSVH